MVATFSKCIFCWVSERIFSMQNSEGRALQTLEESPELVRSPFTTDILNVPDQILVTWVKTPSEVELVLGISHSASILDTILHGYEMVAVRTQAVQEAWDNLWITEDPILAPAIPFIGQKMSELNRIRANLLKKMDTCIDQLKYFAKKAREHSEMNLSFAEELKSEGVNQMAKDKTFMADLENELARRIDTICCNGNIHDICPMSEFINSLEMKYEQTTSCLAVIHNTCCDSSSKANRSDGGTKDAIHCNDKTMDKESGSASFSDFLERNLTVDGEQKILETSSEHNDSAQDVMKNRVPSSAETSIGSKDSQHANSHIVGLNSSSASEEQLPVGLGKQMFS